MVNDDGDSAAGHLGNHLGGESGSTSMMGLMGTWSPSALPLVSMGSYLNQPLVPDELEGIKVETQTVLVIKECHEWAVQSYDCKNGVHQLCLVISWIVCKMMPHYLVEKMGSSTEVPGWTALGSGSKKGVGLRPKCFGWCFLYLLTMLDKLSPIWRQMAAGGSLTRVSCGRDWGEALSKLIGFGSRWHD